MEKGTLINGHDMDMQKLKGLSYNELMDLYIAVRAELKSRIWERPLIIKEGPREILGEGKVKMT